MRPARPLPRVPGLGRTVRVLRAALEEFASTKFEDLPELVTVDEIASKLRIGRSKAYELIESEPEPAPLRAVR